MKTNTIQLALLGLAATLGAAHAAPLVSRLNPPSALFTFGDATPPYTAHWIRIRTRILGWIRIRIKLI